VGYSEGPIIIITNCINLANIYGDRLVGGIVGFAALSTATTLTNCVNVGIIKGNIWVGSIVGGNHNITISRCINFGIMKNENNYIGCIVG
jgi:hypothetical protein